MYMAGRGKRKVAVKRARAEMEEHPQSPSNNLEDDAKSPPLSKLIMLERDLQKNTSKAVETIDISSRLAMFCFVFSTFQSSGFVMHTN